MRILLTFFALTCASAFAQDTVTFEQQANLDVETQLSHAFSKMKAAKDAVISAIDAIGDPKKKELYKVLFERNEKAWDEFIASTALLQQGAQDSSEKPDIRHIRILDAQYSEFRIKQYQDFSQWIRLQK